MASACRLRSLPHLAHSPWRIPRAPPSTPPRASAILPPPDNSASPDRANASAPRVLRTRPGVTTGFLKNDPALRASSSPGTSSIDFCRRISRTASRTCHQRRLGWAVRKPLLQVRISKRRSATLAQREGHSQNDVAIAVNGVEPAAPIPKAAFFLAQHPTSRDLRSRATTSRIVSDTSCPYAPTFCTGVPPTEPGMPLRHSIPAQSASTARATNSSQSSPAAARKIVIHSSNERSTPRKAIFNTSAVEPCVRHHQVAAAAEHEERQPARRRESATLRAHLSRSAASTKYRAGPPTPSVVRGASGTCSRTSWVTANINCAVAASFPHPQASDGTSPQSQETQCIPKS